MTVILLTADLAVISRVEGAAARIGSKLRAASNEAAAIEYVSAGFVDLLIVDLSLASLAIESLVEKVKATGTTSPRIVAFGPHVHVERLNAARDAGCDDVLSRGQFFAQLETVLSK